MYLKEFILDGVTFDTITSNWKNVAQVHVFVHRVAQIGYLQQDLYPQLVGIMNLCGNTSIKLR